MLKMSRDLQNCWNVGWKKKSMKCQNVCRNVEMLECSRK